MAAIMVQPTFLFDTIWPLMKIFQIFGAFPCTKASNNDKVTLVPIKWSSYFLITCVPLVLYVIFAVTWNTFAYNRFLEVMQMQTHFVDQLVMFATIAVFFTVQLSLAISNFTMRIELADLQDFFLQNCQDWYLQKLIRRKKMTCMAIFMPLASLFASLSISLGGTFESYEDKPTGLKIILLIFFGLLTMYIQSQIHAFLVIYMQVTTKIITWANYLTTSTKIELKDYMTLFDGVLMAKKMFSVSLFITVNGAMVNLILVFYASISYLICNSYEKRQLISIIADCIGKIAFGVLLCIILYISNEASQQLLNAMQTMKQAIIEMPTSDDDDVVVLDGKEYVGNYARYVLLERINSFKGFTALDFYDLGRPMLSTITSNFITYLIILIQFKLSASSNDK